MGFVTGLRHLLRRRLFAGLNVAGLAVGLGSFLLIGLFLQHELSHDRHFPDHDVIYRVGMTTPHGGEQVTVVLPESIGPLLVDDFPGVQEAVRIQAGSISMQLRAGDRLVAVEAARYADPNFFDLFPARAVAGDPRQALREPGGIVLTESVARSLFGEDEAVGQVVFTGDAPDSAMLVAAVVADPPRATHLPYDAIMRRQGIDERAWNFYYVWTYIRLAETADREALAAALPDFVERHIYFETPVADEWAAGHGLFLQPLTRIHLDGDITAAASVTPPARYVRIFALVALLLLGIAGINYVNLATAYATERAREVGVRRTLGATRRQLAVQFLGESVALGLLAVPAAGLLMLLVLPYFAEISGVAFHAADLLSADFLIAALAVTIVVGLLSGLYPAYVLSGFSPRRNMAMESGGRGSGAGLRRGLVVLQFAASIALVLCALTISRQMDHVREARLGGIDDQVVMLFVRSTPGEKQAIKEALVASPDVVAASYGPAPNHTSGSAYITDEDTGAFINVRSIFVDEDYLDVLGLELVAGEPLTQETAVPDGTPVLLNETAMRTFDGVLGERVSRLGATPVGVVRDYHFVPLHEPIGPLRIDFLPNNWHPLLVRLEAGRIPEGLDHLRSVWAAHHPDRPLEYRFLDEELDKGYHAELRMGAVFRSMTLLTLFLAGLGLFGLAAYAAQRRTREIGIRKVLGASVTSVVGLLSKDFMRLVAIAFILAAPVGYVTMSRWLEDFAYRVELGPGIFFLTGVAALAIAMLTVGYHAIRAATADPVEAIRSE